MNSNTTDPLPGPPPLALVTGAAGVIGPAITAALRKRGWRVIAADRSEACFALHEKAFGVPVDADAVFTANLDSQSECAALVKRIEHAHGGLHAVIHGAALNQNLSFSSITEADALRHFAINALAFLLSPEARFLNGETVTLDGGLRPDATKSPALSLSPAQRVSRWVEQNPAGRAS